jgi:hypothetical protein
MRIDKTGKAGAPAAPAKAKAPGPAAPSSGTGSFSNAYELEQEQAVIGGPLDGGADRGRKAALASIDDIAARNSLNIEDGTKPKDKQA